jgi:hypothetical protein
LRCRRVGTRSTPCRRQHERSVADVAAAKRAVEDASADGGELAEDAPQRAVDEAIDQSPLVGVVGIERGHHAGAEIVLGRDGEPGRLQGGSPSRDLVLGTKVGVKEMAARAQDPAHFAQEEIEAAIAVRRLDVQDRIEGAVAEREPLGVTDLERQVRLAKATAAERDRPR